MNNNQDASLYSYQMLLLAVEKAAGHKALEEVVDVIRKYDSVSYLHFLQSQTKAKNETRLPYWEVVNNNGVYNLTKL